MAALFALPVARTGQGGEEQSRETQEQPESSILNLQVMQFFLVAVPSGSP